jgi:D-alanyl-D-alanine carboxypeptidase/D-alanyl-D-alanine-endopeptidase (penicillin-binding protein 4)
MKLSGTAVLAGGLTFAVVGGGLALYGGSRFVAPAHIAAAAAWGNNPKATLNAPAVKVIAPAAATAGGPLQAQAQAALGSGAAEWSVLAYDLDAGQTLFAINADKVRTPASNNKVFSGVWALETLGPDYRFPTDLLVTGPIQNGVLNGDVVIRGSGDPAFGYQQYDKDPLTPLRAMAQALKAKGVTSVTGGIVGDASIDDGRHHGPDWPKDTGDGASQYAPTVSGLPFDRNMLWITLTPGGPVTFPENAPIPVVWTSRGGRAFAARKADNDTIVVRGAPGPRGSRYGVGANEPALLAPAALKQALQEAGITVAGGVRLGKTPEGAKLVHRHYSITLGEMLPQLNTHSDNFFAEHFWKAAVAHATGEGSYAKGGPASANFFHQRAGVPYGQLWQADGSGLSANNRTSAFAMVSALNFANQRPWAKVFHESLAVAGKPDGTLVHMFNNSPAAGNLHAKTGYIRGVRSLSGFVKAANGHHVVFSFLYNGKNTSGARGVDQTLGNLLAAYK